MKKSADRLLGFTICVAVLAAVVAIDARESQAQQTADAKVQRFRMNPFHVNIGKITEVAATGTVRVTEIANPRFMISRAVSGRVDLTEGYYLGLVAQEFVVSTKDMRLVRLQVVEVGAKGTATIRVAPQAAPKLLPGEHIVFFRPPGSSTAELQAAPDFAPVDDGTETSVLGKNAVNVAARLNQSRNNLKQVGLAMHNFYDTYKKLPPAVVYGPDGKPWHSWRVLILPFIDQAQLYEKYRFDEPWDGPNNKILLAEMPETYRDPIFGNTDDYYTHYAAITGDGTAFPSEGIKMQANQLRRPLADLGQSQGAKEFREFLDGTSNSLLVGSVSPDRKIPWMKPEDVAFNSDFPALGKKGSFAVPYDSRGRQAGMFLLCDGSVRTITSEIDVTTLRNLLQIADGNAIREYPTLSTRRQQPRGRAAIKQAQIIEIIRDSKGVRARLVATSP